MILIKRAKLCSSLVIKRYLSNDIWHRLPLNPGALNVTLVFDTADHDQISLTLVIILGYWSMYIPEKILVVVQYFSICFKKSQFQSKRTHTTYNCAIYYYVRDQSCTQIESKKEALSNI